MYRSLDFSLAFALLAWVFTIPMFVYPSTSFMWLPSIVFVFLTLTFGLIIGHMVDMSKKRKLSMPSSTFPDISTPTRTAYPRKNVNPYSIDIDWR